MRWRIFYHIVTQHSTNLNASKLSVVREFRCGLLALQIDTLEQRRC